MTRDGAWYAVRTNPNCEQRAVLSMSGAGFYTFLPTTRRWSRHARKQRIIERALLVRYVFAFIRPDQSFYDLRRCHGVEGVVGFDGSPRPIPDRAMDDLMRDEDMGVHDETRPRPKLELPAAGVEMMIRSGPYQGRFATVEEAYSEKRIQLMFEGRAIVYTTLDNLRAA